MPYVIRDRASQNWTEWDCNIPTRGARSTAATLPENLRQPMTESEADEFLAMELDGRFESVVGLKLFVITH